MINIRIQSEIKFYVFEVKYIYVFFMVVVSSRMHKRNCKKKDHNLFAVKGKISSIKVKREKNYCK